MSKPVIHVENLSKAYQIGQIGTGTLSRDLERFWTTKILGKEDPFLKIGETNVRSTKGESNIVWSLKDLNFSINQGDAVGIIGRNGAGKSTLLKLLSRVTAPTTGEIKVKGRIASLLEVGTGFHPELSGRENIYLNGAILGMRRQEIKRKFDEIVDFSGVERYIDTPVKRYSSGMYVRLAFAVAAHLESEILIVDEVLAVGDAEFQKKCLGKMGDISKGEGRTVLFVSHNMASVQVLCSKGILLENGISIFEGEAEKAIEKYTLRNREIRDFKGDESKTDLPIELISLKILNKEGVQLDRVLSGQKVCFEVEYINNTSEEIFPAIGFYDFMDTPFILCGGSFKNISFNKKGFNKIMLTLERFPLFKGEYYLNVELMGTKGSRRHIKKAKKLIVERGDFYKTGSLPIWDRGVLVNFDWKQV